MSKFAKNLVNFRAKNGMSQQQLADDLGVPRSTLACLETDKRMPKHDVLIAIADYFEVSIDYLVGRSDNSKNITLNKLEE